MEGLAGESTRAEERSPIRFMAPSSWIVAGETHRGTTQVGQERPDLGRGRELHDPGGGGVGAQDREPRPRPVGEVPDPPEELRVHLLRAPWGLQDGGAEPADRGGDVHAAREVEEHDRVGELGAQLEGGVVVAVDDPAVRREQVAVGRRPTRRRASRPTPGDQ